MSAASAFIEMTAQGGGTTLGNGQEHFDVLPANPLTVSFDECASCGANEIGHLEGWPAHLIFWCGPVLELERIQRTRGGVQMALGEVQVDRSFFQIAMA